MTVSECAFCRIIREGGVNERGWDDSDPRSVVFEPFNPASAGHKIFVPREHVTDALERPDITGDVFRHAAEWANGKAVSSCNLITSVGIAATQGVFHLHVHMVPRYPEDGLRVPWGGEDGRLPEAR